MLTLRLLDPARARADGRRLMAALGASVVAHGVAAVVWPMGEGRTREVELAAYPVTFTLTDVEPAPSGGGGEPDEAPPLVEPEPPAVLPPSAPPAVPAQDDGVPVPVAEPARPVPTPPAPVATLPARPSAPPAPPGSSRTTPAGSGDGSGGGTGSGTGPGVGARSGDGAGDGGGGTAGPAALVRNPELPPEQRSVPFPVNTPETARGALRGNARVEVLVDENGAVAEARIVARLRLGRGDREEPVASFPAGVDAALLSAARRLLFSPAQHAGHPVRTYRTVTLRVGV